MVLSINIREEGELFEFIEGITAKMEEVKVRKGRCTWPYEENFPDSESYRTMEQSSE